MHSFRSSACSCTAFLILLVLLFPFFKPRMRVYMNGVRNQQEAYASEKADLAKIRRANHLLKYHPNDPKVPFIGKTHYELLGLNSDDRLTITHKELALALKRRYDALEHGGDLDWMNPTRASKGAIRKQLDEASIDLMLHRSEYDQLLYANDVRKEAKFTESEIKKRNRPGISEAQYHEELEKIKDEFAKKMEKVDKVVHEEMKKVGDIYFELPKKQE